MCSNLLLRNIKRNHRLFLIPHFELWNLSLTVAATLFLSGDLVFPEVRHVRLY